MDVLAKEMGSEISKDDLDKFQKECARELERERRKLGTAQYSKQLACVMASTTMEAMSKCDKLEGPPDEPLLASSVEPVDVCNHVLAMMNRDLGDTAVPAEQLEAIRESCISEADKEREADKAKYEREAKCIMASTKLEEISECDSKE
jgi:hypothetical protein